MADAAQSHAPQPKGATGVLVLADGSVLWGRGFGGEGQAVGEVCFNTAMTGYQEVMTDPSYAAQIVTFTFPHIGNVGVNEDDLESQAPGAVGCVVREDVTQPSNFSRHAICPPGLAAGRRHRPLSQLPARPRGLTPGPTPPSLPPAIARCSWSWSPQKASSPKVSKRKVCWPAAIIASAFWRIGVIDCAKPVAIAAVLWLEVSVALSWVLPAACSCTLSSAAKVLPAA